MSDPTLLALRILQLGLEAVKAQGTLTMDTQPTANDTITIGTIVYTWVASGASSGQINRGADLAAAKVNLVAAINGLDSIQAGPNPYASAAAFTSNTMVLSARIPGPYGNTIATTETFTAGTNVFNAVTLGTTTAGAFARGTPVAATTKLAVEEWGFTGADEKIYNPKVQNGNLTRYSGPGVPVQHGTAFAAAEQAAFWDHLPLYFSMLLGAPTSLTGGLGGPYTWVWTVGPSTNPNPYSATIERRLSNGLGDNIDENASYAMLSKMGLSFAVNEALRLGLPDGFARSFATMGGGITSALTLPDFDTMVSALSSVYLDSTWGAVGGTQLSGEVIGWKWDYLGGVYPRYTADARTGLDFTRHQINGGERGIDLELTCLLDPTTYAAERTRAASPSTNQFAVRVRVQDETAARHLYIDQMMQHDNPVPPITEDKGSDVFTLKMVDCEDDTNFMRVTLLLPDVYKLA